MLNDQPREASAGDLGSLASSLIQKLSISSEEESLPVSKEEREFLSMDHLPAAGQFLLQTCDWLAIFAAYTPQYC